MISETLKRFFQSRTKPPSKPASPPAYPLGLSAQQLQALEALTADLRWPHYSAALDRLFEQQAGALFRPLAHDGYLFQCGVAYALQRVIDLPTELSTYAREYARHTADAKRHADSRTPAASAGERTFAGTLWWDAYRNGNPVPERPERPGVGQG